MQAPSRARRALLLAGFAILAGCHRPRPAPATTPAPAPAPAAMASAPAPHAHAMGGMARDSARRGYTAADVRFMHHMMMHHAQALAMTALVPSRTTSESLRRVAERIDVSQHDEIGLMERWLRARGEMVPMVSMEHGAHAGMAGMAGMQHGDTAGGGGHAAMMMQMPGMLTPAEMARLEGASGATFDTLFVQGMIRHHEGALVMVRDYLATPGAAQEPEIFRFASDVDADQRAEIRRLRGLLSP